jgi:hypothetical protein
MLHRAAATGAEMRADRVDAVRARHDHAKHSRAVTGSLHLDRFARQRIGHIDRAFRRLGDGIAAMSHAGDAERLNGGRLSHGAFHAEFVITPTRSVRQESVHALRVEYGPGTAAMLWRAAAN